MSGYNLEFTRVLVVDGDPKMRRVLGLVLQTLGVRTVTEASDGAEAFHILRTSPADIILCDRCTWPVDGPALVHMVRNAPDSPNPFAAVIMLILGGMPHHIAAARESGVHDVLAKPISAKALYDSIRAIIEYPSPFIRAADYFGPNRRWQRTGFAGENHRRNPPRAMDTDEWGQAVGDADDQPVILTPEEIRALLRGGDDDGAFTLPPLPATPEPPESPALIEPASEPEGAGLPSEPLLIPVPAQFQLQVAYSPQGVDDAVVRQAEAVIKGFRDDYLVWAQDDLSRLQECFGQARAASPAQRAERMRPVFLTVYDMAGQGGTFGYPLITAIGEQLCRFIESRATFSDAELRAVSLHIDAMRVVLAQRLEGDGGQNRGALLDGLRAILAKIADPRVSS